MTERNSARIAWALFAVVVGVTLVDAVRTFLVNPPSANLENAAQDLMWRVIGLVFAFVGALIVSRQPRNTIGWLLLAPPLLNLVDAWSSFEISQFAAPPISPAPTLYFALWFHGISWVFLIFPLFLIVLLFPNGAPPSPRWRWVVAYAVVLFLFFVVVISFYPSLTSDPESDTGWEIANPIGLLPKETVDSIFGLWWNLALVLLALLCLASLFVRYRRASAVEKKQIQWLLYAGAMFAVVYVVLGLSQEQFQGPLNLVANLLFPLVILSIPISIGIAILRYRLFDIDIIIRRTVTYAIVVALLLVVYFGSVILLQQLFAAVTGERSEVITVLSTLAIAALFVPLRNQVQNAIDKRFNRKKYDAQKVLQKFSETVRDETNLDQLSAELLGIVNETMQPKSVSLWLKQDGRGK